MTRSSSLFRRFAFVTALFGMVVCGATFAHAADDDFEFAEALYQRGYLDLAEEKFNELIGKGGDRAGDGQYGLALLKRYAALKEAGETVQRRRKPYDEVLKLFAEADTAFATFIKNNGAHGRVLDAKLERARILQMKAEYQAKAMESGWLPSGTEKSAVLADMASAYDTAIGLIKPVEERIRSRIEKIQDTQSDAFLQANGELAIVWLYRLVALHGKGAALPPGNSEGKGALQQVVSELEDYLWQYEDRVQGVWALHYSGLSRWKLDQLADAFADLKDAATYAQPTENKAARKVTFDSFARVADMALEEGGPYVDMALDLIENGLIARWNDYRNDREGQLAALAYAKLIYQKGQGGKALQIAQEILQKTNETGTGLDRAAGDLVSRWLGSGGEDVSIDPADLERVYMAKAREEDWAGCIRAAQSVIASCDSDEEMNQFGWKAWDMIGTAYGIQKRWYACFQAFDVIEQAWRADKENATLSELTTQKTAFSRLRALDQLAKQSKSEADKKLFEEENERFLVDHPDSPDAQDVGDREAAKALADGKALLRKDRAAAMAKLTEAKKLFEEKDDRADSYALDLAKIADIERLMGNYDQAIKLAEAWLAKAWPDSTSSKVRRYRAQGRVLAIRTILQSPADLAAEAQAAKDKEAHKGACELLLANIEKYEEAFLQSVENGELPILQWKVEALVGLSGYGNSGELVDQSEKLVLEAMQQYPKKSVTRYLAAIVASALRRQAAEWEAKGDMGRMRSYSIRAARLQEFVLDSSPGDRNPDVILAVALTYQKGGDFAKAEALLKEALAIYEERKDEESILKVRVMLIDLLVDQGKFDEAIPQLEKRLVESDPPRTQVLERLGKDTSFTSADLKDLMGKMSRNKGILNSLSKAYLAAKDGTQARLIKAINLAFILRYHHPKDQQHNAEFIEYTLRYAKANYEFGVDFGQPVALDNAITLLKSVKIQGLLEMYEETTPGSQRKIEDLLRDAESARSRLK